MEIVSASRNKHKISELQALLSKHVEGVKLLSLDDVGLYDDVEENGSTFEENAFIKADYAARSGKISVGDDSGLCVNALDCAPGIYSARYAGDHGNDAANNAKLLCDLADKKDKSAYFMCTFACVLPDGRRFAVEGRAEGVIIDKASGSGGFGYDPIFFVPELGKTFADLTAEEKNAVSHRGKAVEAFAAKLSEIIR
jgi:XTP/dITP diphosphohydrolase